MLLFGMDSFAAAPFVKNFLVRNFVFFHLYMVPSLRWPMNDTLYHINLIAAVPEAVLLLSCLDRSFMVAYFVRADGSVVFLPASVPPHCIIKDTFPLLFPTDSAIHYPVSS